jgi:UDP-N-acetylglucosamine acyltransferase
VIHPLASIDPSAKIGRHVTIGPGAVIGPEVEIGDDTWIGPHVVIQGPTIIGERNKIFQFASIGDAPQDLTYHNEPTRLEIGHDNTIREYCSIHRGTVKGGGVTSIGHHNFLMAYAHVGHDCRVANHVILVSHCSLSGHVEIDDGAIIGGYSAIHQFCRVGTGAFIARATYVTKDVLPYLMIAGYDAAACGLNSVGLKRRGMSAETLQILKQAYKIIFRKNYHVAEALDALNLLLPECDALKPMIHMLQNSTRGIVR